jgi:CspA family cold shock protein
MDRGEVRWFNDSRGYGFIERENGGEVYVHFSAIRGKGFRTLKPGDQVEMDVVDEGKLHKAVDVVRLDN